MGIPGGKARRQKSRGKFRRRRARTFAPVRAEAGTGGSSPLAGECTDSRDIESVIGASGSGSVGVAAVAAADDVDALGSGCCCCCSRNSPLVVALELGILIACMTFDLREKKFVELVCVDEAKLGKGSELLLEKPEISIVSSNTLERSDALDVDSAETINPVPSERALDRVATPVVGANPPDEVDSPTDARPPDDADCLPDATDSPDDFAASAAEGFVAKFGTDALATILADRRVVILLLVEDAADADALSPEDLDLPDDAAESGAAGAVAEAKV